LDGDFQPGHLRRRRTQGRRSDQYQRFLPYVAEEEVREVENYNAPIRKEIATLQSLIETKAQSFRDKLVAERLAKLPESFRQDLREALATPEQKRNSVEKYLVEKFGPLFKVEIEEEAKRRLKPRPKIRALFDVGGVPPPAYVFRRGNYRSFGP
jgi:hypothetical protein